MSHLLAADSRNSKVQNAVVPRGVPRSTWSLPNDARPQEGNRQARRRRQAEARRLQRKARQPQAKGAVLAPRATAAAAGASRSRVAIKRSTRTGQDGVSPMDSMAPTFEPIASSTTFGPLTDISMGWDGTVWGIDGQGAPHVYDAINDVWAQHGSGIDAAAVSYQPDCAAYIFMGSQVITVTPAMQANPPRPIGDLWPELPELLQAWRRRRRRAAGRFGEVMLFNAGRYVTTDNSDAAGHAGQTARMAANRQLGGRPYRCRLQRRRNEPRKARVHPGSQGRSSQP